MGLSTAITKNPNAANETTPIQVLNLSFPRCGTFSIQEALDTLGYECWHSTDLTGDVPRCDNWIRALDAKYFDQGRLPERADFNELFRGYTAVSADSPASDFAEELIEAYPEAKVILVERDIEQWYRSFDHTLIQPLSSWRVNVVADLDPILVGPLRDVLWKTIKGRFKANNKQEFRANARDVYRQHYATVRRVCPPERLLEYRLGQGWEPLCAFLGKPVPQEPFPRRNNAAEMHTRYRTVVLHGAKIVLGKVAKFVVPALSIALGWWMWRISTAFASGSRLIMAK